jgi:hydrogenase maturation protein HypF
MDTIITEQIKIWGIVQGVGFRPFVAKLAARMGMKGEVLNLGGLVQLTLTDTKERIDVFLDALKAEKPGPSEIVHISRSQIPTQEFTGFFIRSSKDTVLSDDEAVMIPADLSVCPDCLAEMQDITNRRHRHPFISCMACGPRYTIIDRVPYDRPNTSMVDFPMCQRCHQEYITLADRRYHAQTVSCHECGPSMMVRFASHMEAAADSQNDPNRPKLGNPNGNPEFWLDSAVDILKAGGVIGMKAMGGYHLMADPFSMKGVAALRNIKKREEKPFAILFSTVDEIRKYCQVSGTEESLLNSSAKPILLLEQREDGPKTVESDKSRFIGCFLPAMGGQYLLLQAFGGPLIATSANYSGLPIISTESEMFRMMEDEPLIEAVYYHKRNIRISTEDSVVRVIDGQPQMIRRSRGYAPVPLYVEDGQTQIFAAGPQLKNAFALSKGSYIYLSQYFGDLDGAEIQRMYTDALSWMSNLFDIKPCAVACDLHPRYTTTSLAERYAGKNELPLFRVQHHHAHIASVMAEHNLKGRVIGVSFDGTGYGTDGKIWGGEFLLCDGGAFTRKSHLRYIRMLGGDSSMKDARKSALSIIHHEQIKTDLNDQNPLAFQIDLTDILAYADAHNTMGLGDGGQNNGGRNDNQTILKALAHDVNTIESSSMGRLFDGVAALLGICGFNKYEGQCAMLLEDAADWAMKHPGKNPAADLALAFHNRVAETIVTQCQKIRNETDVRQVALTGGVFQNKILMEQSLTRLRAEGFEPYYNISISPNDGGIALGQIYVARQLLCNQAN